MTDEEDVRARIEGFYQRAAAAESRFVSGQSVDQMVDYYRGSLSPAEQRIAREMIIGWLGSESRATAWDAWALVHRLVIVEAIPTVERLLREMLSRRAAREKGASPAEVKRLRMFSLQRPYESLLTRLRRGRVSFVCAVCGYPYLEDPLATEERIGYATCLACGYVFGAYEMQPIGPRHAYAEYREEWVSAGMPWRDQTKPWHPWRPEEALRYLLEGDERQGTLDLDDTETGMLRSLLEEAGVTDLAGAAGSWARTGMSRGELTRATDVVCQAFVPALEDVQRHEQLGEILRKLLVSARSHPMPEGM